MKHLIVPIMVLLAMLCSLDANATCAINGTLTDQRGNPLVAAGVKLMQNGKTVAGAVTDFDGNYCFSNITDGTYDVNFTYQGQVFTVTKVVFKENKPVVLNQRLNVGSKDLKAVVVQANKINYVKPLIDARSPDGYVVHTREDMAHAATVNVTDIATLSTQGYQSRNGQQATLGGGRVGSGTLYVVDGAVLSSGNASYTSNATYLNPSTETYKKDPENDFKSVKVSPLSTISVDVDRASYSNIRRFINQGQKPPADAVRVEEMINYFHYDYPSPKGDDPIAISTELTACPWDKDLKLLHIGIQARKISTEKLPPSNLVFLIDVSGSMNESTKLPLVKEALKLLVEKLREQDKVSIVVYAGNAGMVLPPTSGDQKSAIINALNKLEAGGSTAGGEGIMLAYKTAEEHLVKGGNNRVILATDGDFNVGVSNENELEDLIVKQRDKGIYLTCLGFGMGNYKDSKMELMADKGNGNYDYIDNIEEAQKTLVNEFGGTLFTVAKDVKAQIEFNPAKVQGYRLVGYENRLLNTEDFKDDKKDAGDMGAGHTVTILYEIVPAGVKSHYMRDNDPLKYQQPDATTATGSNELATVKFRYKQPDANVSKEMIHPIEDRTIAISDATENTRFAASVAMFGMLLKGSKYKGEASYSTTIALAETAVGKDKEGYRSDYIKLVKSVK